MPKQLRNVLLIILLINILPMLGIWSIPIIIVLGLSWLLYSKQKNTLNSSFSFLNYNKVPTYYPLPDISALKRKAGITIGIILIIIFLLNAIKVVPAGNAGVFELFGNVSDRELSSGLNLINPLGKVTNMSIRTRDYTMSIAQGEGNRVGDDAIRALTSEGLAVDLDITVLYRLNQDQAAEVYRNVGLTYDETIIRPQIRSTIREVIALYTAKDIYSAKRAEAATQIQTQLADSLQTRGITVEQVLLRNVILPNQLANSIEQKLTAEQESERMEFILERETKEAERKRIEAEGQRDAQQIINQSPTPNYLNYLYIESLKDREGTIYVPTDPNSGVPIFRGI